MHKYLREYPEAPTEREKEAKELFPYLDVTPEIFAAKNAHNFPCFSFGEYIYSESKLNEWLHTLDDILFTEGRLKEVQELYLSEKEIAKIKSLEKEL